MDQAWIKDGSSIDQAWNKDGSIMNQRVLPVILVETREKLSGLPVILVVTLEKRPCCEAAVRQNCCFSTAAVRQNSYGK